MTPSSGHVTEGTNGGVPGSYVCKSVAVGSDLCPLTPGLVLHADSTAADEVARGVLHRLWSWFTAESHNRH